MVNIENVIELIKQVVLKTRRPFVRYSKVRMYYGTKDEENTPTPFAEFRVFLITNNPDFYDRYLDAELEKLEWIFRSVKVAVEKDAAEFEIIGTEVEKIDPDEVAATYATTGLDLDDWHINEVYRYVAFFGRDEEIKKDYNEVQIAGIERSRRDSYREWVLKIKASGMWRERKLRRRLKELEKRQLLKEIL